MVIKIEEDGNKSEGVCKLAIDDDLTIYTITALKQEISTALESPDNIELNLEKVDEIDSSGIQLLLAMKNELLRSGKQLKLVHMSTAVCTLLDTYSLSNHFDIGDSA